MSSSPFFRYLIFQIIATILCINGDVPQQPPQQQREQPGALPVVSQSERPAPNIAGDHVTNGFVSSPPPVLGHGQQARMSPNDQGAAIPPPAVPFPQPHQQQQYQQQQQPHQLHQQLQHPQQAGLHQVPLVPVVDRRGPPPPPPVAGVPPLPPPLHMPPNQALHFAPSASGPFLPDNDLEVQHEFKIAIGPGREECLYQRAKPQSRFYFSFKVLSGADGVVDVIVRSPDGNVVDQHIWSKGGTSDKFMSFGEGPFSVCMANVQSRFSAQLVHVFLATYVVEEWQRYDQELRQVDGSLGNSTVSLHKVAKGIGEMRLHQSWSRQQSAGDYYIIRANNEGIQFWSVAMCVVVVGCSLAQVAFVHRLFDDKRYSSNGNKKLRA